MKKSELITQTIGNSLLKIKIETPTIFFGAGVVGSLASTVLACRATLKLHETLDEIQKEINIVNNEKPSLSVSAYRTELSYVYARAVYKITKLYAPPVIIGVASIGLLTSSHIQLTRRNQALMAAYALVQNAYDEYRERVQKELGEEKEFDLYRGITEEKHGNEVVKVVDPNAMSPYARFFDEYSVHWDKDPELNLLYVQCQQNYANDLLRARGHVFLNDVYDMLGIDRSSAGSVVGWVIGKEGDNYIDFGIYEVYNSKFVNGMERSILLDFNVDGVIYDKI